MEIGSRTRARLAGQGPGRTADPHPAPLTCSSAEPKARPPHRASPPPASGTQTPPQRSRPAQHEEAGPRSGSTTHSGARELPDGRQPAGQSTETQLKTRGLGSRLTLPRLGTRPMCPDPGGHTARPSASAALPLKLACSQETRAPGGRPCLPAMPQRGCGGCGDRPFCPQAAGLECPPLAGRLLPRQSSSDRSVLPHSSAHRTQRVNHRITPPLPQTARPQA